MATHDIPKDEWATFFESFSRQHEGWLVTLEVLGSDIGARVESGEEALISVTCRSEKYGCKAIIVVTANPSKGHFTRTIPAPVHVSLKETEEGAHESVQIESNQGMTMVLRFRSAILPELVDGMVQVP